MSDSVVLNRLSTVDFSGLINALIDGGWVEFFFPFLLIYAIVLTIMNRADVFKKSKPTRVIIALVFALFSTVFPVSETCDVDVVKHMGYCTLGTYMSALFPGVSLFAIIVLCLYIVAALLGRDLTEFFGKDNNIVLYVLGAIGLIVVGWQWASAFFEFGGGRASDFWLVELLQDPILYVLILFVLLFWWISKEDDADFDYSNGSTTVNVGNNNGGNP